MWGNKFVLVLSVLCVCNSYLLSIKYKKCVSNECKTFYLLKIMAMLGLAGIIIPFIKQ